MFGWIIAAILAALWMVGKSLAKKALPPTQYEYRGNRKWRTPRSHTALELWVMAFIICLPVVLLLYRHGSWGDVLACAAGGATLATGFIIVVGWGCCATSQVLIDGPDAFLKDIATGGDPFFDAINGDSDEVQAGGPPADISPANFTPPASWTDVCGTCGAKQPSPVFYCWNCGTGWDHGRLAFRCPSCGKVSVEPFVGAAGQYDALTCIGCGFQIPTRG